VGLGEQIDSATAVCTYQPGVLSASEYSFVCDSPTPVERGTR
jgi:hypothetical protein